MRSSTMDRRVTIERMDVSTNSFNENVETWSPITTVWAAKQDISDRERFAANQVSASITTRFQIRYSRIVRDISVLDRLRSEGRVYEIVGVKEIGRRDGIELTASARIDHVAG